MEKIYLVVGDMAARRGVTEEAIRLALRHNPDSLPPLANLPSIRGKGKYRKVQWHIEDVLVWERATRALPDDWMPSVPFTVQRRGPGRPPKAEQIRRQVSRSQEGGVK